MDKKFTTDDLKNAIFFLRNFYLAGIMTSEALREMKNLQPKHAEFWSHAAKATANGATLSSTLQPILDQATHTAIHAAENAGNLPEVLDAIDKVFLTKEKIKKALMSLLYPFGMLFAALGVFLFFMVKVVPMLAKSLPAGQEKNATLRFAEYTNAVYMDHGVTIAATLLLIVISLAVWLRDPENQNRVLATIDRIPTIGNAIRDLYFGFWSMQMSLATRAGITVVDAITLTNRGLPNHYRSAVIAIHKDATQRGLAASADPSLQPANDPRKRIPYFVANAFRFAEATGDADKNFERASDALIYQSTKMISIFVETAKVIIFPLSAALAGGSILPYFSQIGSALANLH